MSALGGKADMNGQQKRASPQREDGPFGKGGCGDWICSRTYQVGAEKSRLKLVADSQPFDLQLRPFDDRRDSL
jgi:hypothetical protein